MLVATESAVYALECSGRQVPPEVVFRGGGVRRVAREGRCSVVALEGGRLAVYRNRHLEHVSTGIAEPVHSLLVLQTDPLRLLIGTEPPHVYRLTVGEGEAERMESFEELDCRGAWHTPWGGPPALRSLARTGDGWVYADIHVGSIMRSPDGGTTWEPVTPQLHEDVHQVSTCPADDERVYAQTADAFWLSEDRGGSWAHRSADLGERYGRCVTVHPRDPDLLLATVSDGPHGGDVHGQLYRSEDAGRSWAHVADGFPGSAAENIDTFHVTFCAAGSAWACVGRDLYVGYERATEWERLWQAPEEILMLSAAGP
jgi:hypothetical protein